MNTLGVTLSVCARSLNRCSVTFTARQITGSQWTFGYFAVVLRRKHDAVGGEQVGAHHAAIPTIVLGDNWIAAQDPEGLHT